MLKGKRTLTTLLCIIFLIICTCTVSAITVGQPTSFFAGTVEESQKETSNSLNRTEEQKNKDEHNRNNYRQVRKLKKELVESIDENTIREYYYLGGGEITITVPKIVPIDELQPILDAEYYPDSRDYEIDEYIDVRPTIKTDDEQRDALLGAFKDNGFDLSGATQTDILEWNPLKPLNPPRYNHNMGELVRGGAFPVRDIGGTIIVDTKTYDKRYELIEKYIDWQKDITEIETVYILEIRAESAVEHGLYNAAPKTWYNTGATHFWQIEFLSGDDNYHAPINVFGGDTHEQTFYMAGDYRVSATQVVENTYRSAISYTISEYWVVAETGQVIWSYESEGVTLNPDSLKPLSQLGIEQIVYYSEPNTKDTYVTVFDEVVTVTDDGVKKWDGPFMAPGIWGYDFTTERID